MYKVTSRIRFKIEKGIGIGVTLLLVSLLGGGLGACASSQAADSLSAEAKEADTLTISVASSLIPLFQEIGAAYTQQNGTTIALNSGATTQLGHQIEQGAPVDLFAAADAMEIHRLAEQKHLVPTSIYPFAIGHLILWSRSDSPIKIQSIEDLVSSSLQTISLANPQIAPYGRAAEEVLHRTALYSQVEPKLVFGQNVRQAMQFAETGDADVAFTSLSLGILSSGNQLSIPSELHTPLEQTIAIVASSPKMIEAERFIAFMRTQEAQVLLAKYGYTVPN